MLEIELEDLRTEDNVRLSIKALVIATALLKALSFLFVSLMNLILPPYGGALLAMTTSLYPGYDPTAGPISVFIGTLYALLGGAAARALRLALQYFCRTVPKVTFVAELCSALHCPPRRIPISFAQR